MLTFNIKKRQLSHFLIEVVCLFLVTKRCIFCIMRKWIASHIPNDILTIARPLNPTHYVLIVTCSFVTLP